MPSARPCFYSLTCSALVGSHDGVSLMACLHTMRVVRAKGLLEDYLISSLLLSAKFALFRALQPLILQLDLDLGQAITM